MVVVVVVVDGYVFVGDVDSASRYLSLKEKKTPVHAKQQSKRKKITKTKTKNFASQIILDYSQL